jgi:imidazolonepropionase-like amidohydrolase
MKYADLVVLNCNQLLTCQGLIPKRSTALKDVGIIKNGCIASLKGTIVFIGHYNNFQNEFSLTNEGEIIDAKDLTVLPGFVDPHTHLPFAGGREEEFSLRLQGYSYQQLAEKGMGIQTSVKATRRASREELVFLCLSRLDSMLLHGTTTVEAKSGYGLNLKDEIKQLEAIREANVHLMALSEEGIQAISQSNTAATLLPAVPFFLMQEKKAPARALINKGAIVALATDFNPGSSMTESMHFIMQLAVYTLGMGIEESINAATANAAYAAGIDKEVGSLEIGKKMDLILCDSPNYLYLVYHLGINPVKHVIKNGQIVIRDRQPASDFNQG